MPGPYDFPAYPMSEYDPPPAQPPMSPMPNIISPPGGMPMDQQQMLIEEIKRMTQSPNKAERDAAQKFMSQFGRSMFAVGLNQATGAPWRGSGQQGLSDQLMSVGQNNPLSGYSPKNMDFSKRLTQAVRPDEYMDAEMIGKALSFGTLGAPGFAARTLRPLLNPGGTPPAGPGGAPPGPTNYPPPSPLSPAGPQVSPNPGGPMPGPQAPPEMQGPPQWPQFLQPRRPGSNEPPPDPNAPATPGELNVGDFLDTGRPPSHARYQNRGSDGRFEKGFQPERRIRWYDPFRRLFRED